MKRQLNSSIITRLQWWKMRWKNIQWILMEMIMNHLTIFTNWGSTFECQKVWWKFRTHTKIVSFSWYVSSIFAQQKRVKPKMVAHHNELPCQILDKSYNNAPLNIYIWCFLFVCSLSAMLELLCWGLDNWSSPFWVRVGGGVGGGVGFNQNLDALIESVIIK